jgi:predicted nucleotidyltransferase
MDRQRLLAHLQRTHFAPGDRDQAQADARVIAAYLKREYGARVIGIGSAFAPDRPFRQTSDIDLVVEGLPARAFYCASACAAAMTRFALDLIPLESATPLMRRRVESEGVPL